MLSILEACRGYCMHIHRLEERSKNSKSNRFLAKWNKTSHPKLIKAEKNDPFNNAFRALWSAKSVIIEQEQFLERYYYQVNFYYCNI